MYLSKDRLYVLNSILSNSIDKFIYDEENNKYIYFDIKLDADDYEDLKILNKDILNNMFIEE